MSREEKAVGVKDASSEKEPDVIVLDIGTGSIKAGWAGEDAPRVVVPTVVLDHHGQAMPAAVMDQHQLERNEYAVGHQALQALHLSSTRLAGAPSSNLSLLRPLERGEIRDYETCQKLLDHIFKNELRVNPKDHPVMLTVSPLCSPESRADLAKLMFDVFNVPSLCMANQAVLSLYSTGRTTGVVLESGEGMTYCVPIYEGFALKHAVLSIPVAGGDLTAYLMRNLAERGFVFPDSQADTVRDIKEKLCRVKPSKSEFNIVPIPSALSAVANASPDVDETSYELPDGQMIRLDDHCRFNTLEILFAPERYAAALGTTLTGGANKSFGIPAQMQAGSNTPTSGGGNPPGSASSGGGFGSFGSGGGGGSRASQQSITIDLSTNELMGVHHLLAASLRMVDAFLRRELLKNIVLAGGTSMAKGFGERVKREVSALVADETAPAAASANASDASPALNIVTDSQRKYAAWIGASMYASLPTFGIIKITADQYKRDEAIVHKKFF